MKTVIYNASFILLLLLISCSNKNAKAPAVENLPANNAAATVTDSATITSIQNDSTAVNEEEEKEEKEASEKNED